MKSLFHIWGQKTARRLIGNKVFVHGSIVNGRVRPFAVAPVRAALSSLGRFVIAFHLCSLLICREKEQLK